MQPVLHLASHLLEPLQWFVRVLDCWTSRERYRMGGGSVLAARWRHRHSTDIGLFFDELEHADMPLSELFSGFGEMEKREEITGLEVYAGQGFLFSRHGVPISFFGTRAVSASPLSNEKEAKTGISIETTEEILLKKSAPEC